MTQRHAEPLQEIDAATANASKQRTIDALIAASPSVLLLRDGELVLRKTKLNLMKEDNQG